jgi:hypothetical protein
MSALLTSENLPVAFAVGWVVVLVVGALIGLFNKKIKDRGRFFERYFASASTAVAAIALIESSWQNRLAANDSRESALASERSAQAAEASLTIVKAPALTLNCDNNAIGKPAAYFGLSSDTVPNAALEPQPIPNPPPHHVHVSYLTCVINNYGQQPILDAILSTWLNFSPATGIDIQGAAASATFTVASLPSPVPPIPFTVRIDGVAAGGSYTFWVGNEGRIGFLFTRPQSISFHEPDGTANAVSFSRRQKTQFFLPARTDFASGEPQGSASIQIINMPTSP